MQYIQIIIPAVLVIFVLFGWCNDLLKQLKLKKLSALLILAVAIVGNIIPTVQTGKVVFGWGGIFLIALALFWWLFDRKVGFFRGLLGTLASSIIYLMLVGMSDAVTALAYGEFFLGFLMGAAAFLFTKQVKTGVVVSVLSSFIGEVAVFFKNSQSADIILNIGAYTQYSVIVTALFICLMFYGTVNFFSRRKTNKRVRAHEFEAAAMYDDTEDGKN